MSRPANGAPDRVTDSHTEATLPWPPPHEADTVAVEK